MKAKILEEKWLLEWFDERMCYHMPSLTLADNGNMLAVWNGGFLQWNGDPMGRDAQDWVSVLEPGAEKWSNPDAVGCDIRYACHDPIFVKNKAGEIILPEIAAGESKHINLPYGKLPMEGQVVLTCFLVLAEDKGILPAGTILSHGQTVYGEMAKPEPTEEIAKVTVCDNNIGIRGNGLGALLEKRGGIISFRDKAGKECVLRAPQLSLFRAHTDNDRGNHTSIRQGIYHMISRYSWSHEVKVDKNEEGFTTLTYGFSNMLLKDFEMTVVYTIRRDDEIDVTVNWPGVADLPDMPALGLSFQLDPRLDTVNYYGLGPDENYADRCEGAYLGWHSYKVEDATELDMSLLDGCRSVGVCGATSTPLRLMEEVAEAIRNKG